MKATKKNKEDVMVFQKSGQIFTTSLDIADKFGKTHRDVMRAINNLSCSTEFSLRNFAQSDSTNSRGKKIRIYHITRDGFSFFVMGFTGKESAAWKEKYIDAFNRLESAYKRQQDPEHLLLRTDSKKIRRGQADAIQAFIEYAKENGSNSANYYYMAFTKMQNNALFIADIAKPKNKRDLLNTEQLFQIGIADQLIAGVIREGIKVGMHYKEIFKAAKRKILAFAELVGVSGVPSLGLLGHNSKHMHEYERQEAVTSCPKPESCRNQPSAT